MHLQQCVHFPLCHNPSVYVILTRKDAVSVDWIQLSLPQISVPQHPEATSSHLGSSLYHPFLEVMFFLWANLASWWSFISATEKPDHKNAENGHKLAVLSLCMSCLEGCLKCLWITGYVWIFCLLSVHDILCRYVISSVSLSGVLLLSNFLSTCFLVLRSAEVMVQCFLLYSELSDYIQPRCTSSCGFCMFLKKILTCISQIWCLIFYHQNFFEL